MDTLFQDLRYAARSLLRSPGFTLVAVLTLALGIGANTAIFSVVNAVLLRPLPFPDAERVTHVGWRWGGNSNSAVPPFYFAYIREHSRVFEGLATYQGMQAGLEEGGRHAEVKGLRVSDDFFRVIGLQPALGRGFLPEEAAPNGPPVAVLSHEFWRNRLAGDPGLVGQVVRLNGKSHTVVGVLPPGFRFPASPEYTDVLVPLQLVPDPQDRGFNYPMIGRLKPGATREGAAADLQAVFGSFRTAHAELVEEGMTGPELLDFQTAFVGGLATMLWVLLGAVGFVLLIACVNVAGLLLARATERQREIAIRASLGAGRGRIVRQLLTESLLLALVAGALGLVLGVWSVDALLALVPQGVPRTDGMELDWRVLGFAFAIALGTGIVFGLAAALPATRTKLVDALKQGGRSAVGGASRARGVLVAAEVALSVVLLAGAGLLIATLLRMGQVELGFNPENVVAVSFPRTPEGYETPEAVWNFDRQLLERIGAMAGVTAVASASSLPLERGWNFPMSIQGRPDDGMGDAEWRAISPDYFRTLGIPTVRGRTFQNSDDASGPGVILVNQAMARRLWPEGNPVGSRIVVGTVGGQSVPGFEDPVREVVGVVADIREMGLDRSPKPTIYVPQAQAPAMLLALPDLLVRTSGATALGQAVRQAARELDPRIPEPQIRSMREVVAASVAPQRFNAVVMGVFAALALVLTAVGIYGVIAYSVRHRTREIGVRMALGARQGEVLGMVLRQGMLLVLAGAGIGLLAALALTRFLAAMLYGVGTTDPLTFLAVTLLLVAVSLLACYLPARRATRVDPMIALRAE
jgi:predicted permease